MLSRIASAVNLRDFEAAARERLDPVYYDYFASGAQDEMTVAANETEERVLTASAFSATIVPARSSPVRPRASQENSAIAHTRAFIVSVTESISFDPRRNRPGP